MKTSLRSRVFLYVAGLAMAGSLFVFAGGASAAALTNSQITAILTLLQSFGVDQTTIANVQGVLTGTGSVAPSGTTLTSASSTTPFPARPSIVYPNTASSSCATLSGDVHPGSHGTEVEQLQAFLAKNPQYYPQGIVSGYYGKLTEDAVARWQAAQGIVSTGTPQTTGYGEVGPQTRASMDHQMEVECESGDQSGSASTDHASATSTEAHAAEGESHASATSSSAQASGGTQGSDSQHSSTSSVSSRDN